MSLTKQLYNFKPSASKSEDNNQFKFVNLSIYHILHLYRVCPFAWNHLDIWSGLPFQNSFFMNTTKRVRDRVLGNDFLKKIYKFALDLS